MATPRRVAAARAAASRKAQWPLPPRKRTRVALTASYDAASLDHADEHGNDGYDQQHVDESAQRVRADHAQKPQREQDCGDQYQHSDLRLQVEQTECQPPRS